MKPFFGYGLHDFGGVAVFKGNLNKKNYLARLIHVPDAFTTEILKIWSEISYVDSITSIDHFLSLPLWHNSLVRIGNKPIFYKSWFSKGIQTVSHLIKEADKLLSFPEFKERFDVKANFLIYHGVVSCIKSLRKATKNQYANNRNFSTFVDNFTKVCKSNRLAYEKLVSAKQRSPIGSQEKWCVDCSLQGFKAIDWEMAYKLLFAVQKLPN